MCLDAILTQKKQKQKLSFHIFPRDIFLREKWVNCIKGKDFIPSDKHCVCLQYFNGAKKHGRADVLTIFPLLPQTKNRNSPKMCLHLYSQSKEGKLEQDNQKHLVDAVEEEVDFCVDWSIPWKRKEMTEALT